MKGLSRATLGCLASLFLLSCGNGERQDLFEAQLCIDNIEVGETTALDTLNTKVDTCMAKIAGQNTSDAFLLRCSGDFIRQGIAEIRIVRAVQALNSKENTTDPTSETMKNMAFQQIGDVTATAASQEAINNCTRSESQTLVALANVANFSTILSTFASGADNLDTFIDNFDPNDAAQMSDSEKVELANAVIASQDSLCDAESGLASDSETCDNIDDAIASAGGATEAEKVALINDFMSNLNNSDN